METLRDLISIEEGYAIYCYSGGFCEINELDWTLAGSLRTAELFDDEESAKKVMADESIEGKIIKVYRTSLCFLHPMSDKQIQLLREFIK